MILSPRSSVRSAGRVDGRALSAESAKTSPQSRIVHGLDENACRLSHDPKH